MIKDLETSSKEVRAYNGTLYLPGVVGLNNIKANDYCNVVLQALSHVTPIRNYFLDANSYAKIKRRPGDQNAHELLVVSETLAHLEARGNRIQRQLPLAAVYK